MTPPKLLADHNLNDHVVSGVLRRDPTISFVRTRERGWRNLPDPELLERAAGEGRILVTHDKSTMRDFAFERVMTGLPMSGVFVLRPSASLASVIDALAIVCGASDADEWRDDVHWVPQ